jgi:hypothetical protein
VTLTPPLPRKAEKENVNTEPRKELLCRSQVN